MKVSNTNYGEDAIKVGTCKAGEDIRFCTADQNLYGVDYFCKPGTGNNAFTITCVGNPQGKEKNSCSREIKGTITISIEFIFGIRFLQDFTFL